MTTTYPPLPVKFDSVLPAETHWPWVGSRVLRAYYLNMGSNTERTLRDTLPEGLYWGQLPESRLITWNARLVQDYAANGNSPEHQRLVERYLKSRENS